MSRSLGSRKSSRNADLLSLFKLSLPKVSTVTGIGGVLVAKRRTVVTFGLAHGRVSKVPTLTGIGSWSRNAKLSSLLESCFVVKEERGERGESREERREETREKRGEEKGGERKRRGERRGEERRGEERRGERRGERREERRERREERQRERGERREERRQDDPGPKFPDWCRAWGVIIFAMYVPRVRIRVRGSYQDYQVPR